MPAVTPGMPDTFAYYHAAYVAAAVLYAAYSVGLWLRARRVRARLRALDGGAGEGGRR